MRHPTSSTPVPATAVLSPPLARFFAAEIRNEAAGGDQPATLDSAAASFAQLGTLLLRDLFESEPGAALPSSSDALAQELDRLCERYGGYTPLAALLDASAEPRHPFLRFYLGDREIPVQELLVLADRGAEEPTLSVRITTEGLIADLHADAAHTPTLGLDWEQIAERCA
jgi:hypothetical protein